ncbi:MAG: translation initiation factor IF-3 [Saccharofermentanales bacterium]
MINEDIRFSKVRVVDANGEMIGIIPIEDALDKARQVGLDLVLVSPNPQNPVAKIMDYGKYAYDQAKREREARRNQKTTTVKEVQLKLTTEEHDLDFKVRNAKRFLNDGDRVKVVIRFRGREMAHQEQGYDVMKNFAEASSDSGLVDRPPRIEGRHMIMYLAPHKDKAKTN